MKVGDIEIIAFSDEGQELTIREYFQNLMLALWKEKERFSGKRPFGNSGWTCDIEMGLVKAGFVDGKIDKNGYLEKVDEARVDRIITAYLKNPELEIKKSS
jgi:hypothetical protein